MSFDIDTRPAVDPYAAAAELQAKIRASALNALHQLGAADVAPALGLEEQ